MRVPIWAALCLAAAIAWAPDRAVAAPKHSEAAALDAVTRDACRKDVVLLGESTHGDGRTVAIKAALVKRLVDRCGFNAVFFEGSFYDFLEIERRVRAHEAVTPQMVSSAVGWLWNHDAEFEPLIPFLTEAVMARRVVIGGIDDQVANRGMFYSLEQMPRDLEAEIPPARREACYRLIRQRTAWDYSDDAPHTPAVRDQVRQCLVELRAGIEADRALNTESRDDDLALVDNLQRAIARDFDETRSNFEGRDYSMFQNLRWLAQRLPPHSKIIVWCATTHAAKAAHNLPNYGDGDLQNLGAYVHAAYGSRAFAVGVTATSGSYRWSSGENRPIPAPPPDALEALALKPDEAVYIDAEALAKRGVVPSELFQHQYRDADWSKVLDGVIVIGEERPPERTDR